ncbi:MAG: hypothetical protein OZ948_12860 [Deltaproteobacteria bacterium]|nr:hypothetical protein [Deltaproteobacteria bacterium]
MSGRSVSALGAILDRLGIAWTLIGALAANRYRREVRLTGDVDVLVAHHGPGLVAFEAAFSDAGWSVRRGTPDGAILRLRHPTLGAADVVLAETDYQRSALERARRETIEDGAPVRVLRVEDVIVHKLIAGRPRDVDDIVEILAAGSGIDAAYVEHWAAFWDVLERWRQLRNGAR